MARWCVVASWLLLLSCQRGGSTGSTGPTVPEAMLDGKAPPTTAEPAGPAEAPPTPTASSEMTPAAACARFKVLAAEGCAWTARFPPEFATGDTCEQNLAAWLDPSAADRDTLARIVDCWKLGCEDAVNCMVAAQSGAAARAPRKCGDEGAVAIEVDAATWAARRGHAAKRFSDVKTTEAEPVEVCDIDGEVAWMTRVTCNDGSNPYGSPAVVNESRDGWIARGGRCNSILDRFTVRCPEATYTIHVDRYVCPAASDRGLGGAGK